MFFFNFPEKLIGIFFPVPHLAPTPCPCWLQLIHTFSWFSRKLCFPRCVGKAWWPYTFAMELCRPTSRHKGIKGMDCSSRDDSNGQETIKINKAKKTNCCARDLCKVKCGELSWLAWKSNMEMAKVRRKYIIFLRRRPSLQMYFRSTLIRAIYINLYYLCVYIPIYIPYSFVYVWVYVRMACNAM